MKTRKDSTYFFLFANAAAASAIPRFYELEPGANDLFTDSSDPEYGLCFSWFGITVTLEKPSKKSNKAADVEARDVMLYFSQFGLVMTDFAAVLIQSHSDWLKIFVWL